MYVNPNNKKIKI